jgi:hypothetical protein
MKVAVSGASGMVGRALRRSLEAAGHVVAPLVRRPASAPEEISWDPARGQLDPAAFEGCDAVVHLAGENIASGRWSAAKKRAILESRVAGTSLLAGALAGCASPPGVLVSASAIGYYGDRGAETLDEESAPGSGFLPEVCRAWEDAARPATERGVRVVHPRIGMVLSPDGGALKKMLPPFRMGLGGRLGSGEQFMSWIALDDLVGVIRYALESGELRGAVNAVAPQPVTNREFTATLGRVLKRPTVFPAPSFGARLLFGELADALLLSSARVVPKRLEASGYAWEFADLESALRHLLGKPG